MYGQAGAARCLKKTIRRLRLPTNKYSLYAWNKVHDLTKCTTYLWILMSLFTQVDLVQGFDIGWNRFGRHCFSKMVADAWNMLYPKILSANSRARLPPPPPSSRAPEIGYGLLGVIKIKSRFSMWLNFIAFWELIWCQWIFYVRQD